MNTVKRGWIVSLFATLGFVSLSTAGWFWGSNVPDAMTNLSKKQTRMLLNGLANPPTATEPQIYAGGLIGEKGKAKLCGESERKWWLWAAVDVDGNVVGAAITEDKPSSGTDLATTFVRVDPRKKLEMKRLKGSNTKLRLITHVLDSKGTWRALKTNTVDNSSCGGFEQLVRDILDEEK